MSPTLSVIVPAYNARPVIGGCLRSVLSGCGEGVEVVVVDDGSADGTAEACREFGDPRVRVLSQSNAGVSAARNLGLDAASGDLVMFVDADDELAPGWFSVVGPHLSAGEDVTVFMGGLERERYDVDELVWSIVGADPRRREKPGRMPMKWASSPFSRTYSRRFLKTGGMRFDTRLINGEDALFNLVAFLSTGRVRFVGKSIYRYRIHASSATHTFDSRFFASNEAYLACLAELLRDSGRYSESEVSALVDFSFCRSVEIMALRAAWAGNGAARRLAVAAVNADPLVRARMAAGADTGANPLHERAVYALARAGRLDVAVVLLRAALAAKGRKSEQERWVNI